MDRDVDKYFLRSVGHDTHRLVAGMQNPDAVWQGMWQSEPVPQAGHGADEIEARAQAFLSALRRQAEAQ